MQVGQKVVEEAGENRQGRPGDNHKQQQGHGQAHVQLGEALNTLVQPRNHRNQGDDGDDDNQQHLAGVGGTDPEQVFDACCGLFRAQTEGGDQTKQGGEHREDIDHMARPTPHPLTKNRVEDRANRQRQALVEGEQRQRQGDNGVDRPRVQAPVEDGCGHAQAHGLFGITGRAAQRRPVGAHTICANADTAHGRTEVRHRLRDAIEHQANAHPGGKQHGEPAEVGVIRLCVHAAEAHLAQRGNDQAEAEQHKDVRGADKEPGHVVGEPVAQGAEQRLDLGLQGQGQHHEQHGDDCRDGEDLAVDVQVEQELAFDVVLTDHVIGVDQIGVAGGCRDAVQSCRFWLRGRVRRRVLTHGGLL